MVIILISVLYENYYFLYYYISIIRHPEVSYKLENPNSLEEKLFYNLINIHIKNKAKRLGSKSIFIS